SLGAGSASTFGLAFSPDGQLMAAAGLKGEATIWETGNWTVRHVVRAHSGIVRSLAFSPDGRWLVTIGFDGSIALWDRATWTLQKKTQLHDGALRHVDFSPARSS